MSISSAASPCNRNQRSRALGRIFLCVVVMLLGAGAGYPQWLETKITLPDTLGGATSPTCLTTDTSERYVYIGDKGLWGGGGGVFVVDAEALSRVARIPAGYVSSVCTNTRRNKVYAADSAGNRVLVISCVTNHVIATIPTAKPAALCYNGVDDKIYVASYVYGESGRLSTVDCSSDTVVVTMQFGEGEPSLCYNPAANRVFCWTHDTLLVIDGASDSVVATYPGAWEKPLVVNAASNKVYACHQGSGVLALDGTTGAALDTLSAGTGDAMCVNPRTQKLYVANGEARTVSVYDCVADTLITWFHLLRVTDFSSIACDTVADRVYATGYWQGWYQVLVIDGIADTLVAEMQGPKQGLLLAGSRRGRMYCTDVYGPALAVWDTRTDSLLHNIFIGGESNQMCYDSTDDKVYYASYSFRGGVGAINPATNKPVAHIQVGSDPQAIVWHAPANRVYCGGGSDITVIDPTADTVTKALPVAGFLLCSAPRVNKVYAYDGNNSLNVIDCGSDSVIKTIPLPDVFWVFAMCYVAYDKLYVSGFYDVFVIDCIKDSLIWIHDIRHSLVRAGRDDKRVHCANPEALRTFDPAGDTLIAEVPWDATGGRDMIYASGVDKLYVNTDSSVLVADGATDSLVAEIELEDTWAIGYDSASSLVCCGYALDSALTFIDSRTDDVVTSFNSGFRPETFIPVPAHRRVFVGGWSGSFIPVIRTDPSGVDEAARSFTLRKFAVPTILPRSSPLIVSQPSVLLDAVGRKVIDLNPGKNGLVGCRTGVYFIRYGPDGIITKILLVD